MNKIINDEFGPEYIVKVYDHKTALKGVLVIDNTKLGPGKGGVRMTSNLTEEEVVRLARTMTWKNALAGVPFGGAKAGIVWNGGSDHEKKGVVQAFAMALKPFVPKKYITGPDVNTGEREMQWFVEATGIWKSATGKPANLCMQFFGRKGEKCGIPHEFGSTGWGVTQSAKAILDILKLDVRGLKISIHGFGNVGTFAYQFLSEMGAKIIAIADKDGAAFYEPGFEAKKINEIIKAKKSIVFYPGAKIMDGHEFWKIPVDMMIPASVTDVINDSNKNDIKAKIIVEAGNIPMQEDVEDELFRKGIIFVPDFVANAGGVISSYAEYRGYNPEQMFKTVQDKIKRTTNLVMKRSIKEGVNPRQVALELAKKRIFERDHNAK